MYVKRTKRSFAALAMLLLLVGTVAAVVFSNSLSGDIDLVSQYSIRPEWKNGSPWTGNAFMDVPYTGTINATNLGDAAATLYMKVLITTPAGVTTNMFVCKINNVALTFTGSAPSFEGMTTSAGGIEPHTSVDYTFSFMFPSANSPVLGTYSITIYAWKL